jgi:GAF domain-containing protein
MSENWNKKQLNKRLSSIFSDLDNTQEIPGLSIFNKMSGWIWEIDTQGFITKCSPDIESFLGYNPETILYQPLSSISNFDIHSENLPTSHTVSIAPVMIELTFYHINGTKTASTAYVLPRFDENDTFTGWRGVTILTPQVPQISLPKQPIAASTESDLPLLGLLSPDDIADPIPSMLVEKPETITEVSPETKEALELIEAEEQQDQEDDDILIEESFAVPQPQPSDQVKEFLKSIDSDPDRVWDPEELQLVEQVHSQLELALENANLFQQTQRALSETDEQARRLRLLNEMSEKLAQAQNLPEIYAIASETGHEIFQADRTTMCIFTENKTELEIFNVIGEIQEPYAGDRLPYKDSIHQTALEERRIIISPQTDAPTPENIQSSIIGPIISAEEKLGTLNFGSKQANAFSQQDQTFLAQLLTLLNSVIENRSLFEDIENALSETDEQARRLRLLNEMSEKLAQIQDLDEIYTIVTQTTQEIFNADFADISLIVEGSEEFEIKAIAGQLDQFQPGDHIPMPDSFIELTSTHNYAAFVSESAPSSSRPESFIVGPIFSANKLIGAIFVSRQKPNNYSQQDATFLNQVTSLLNSTIENRTLFQQIQRRSLQLETSAEVSRIASTILDPTELLPEVVELIKSGFGLYYAGIFLIDENGDWTGEPNKWAVLRAGSGEAGMQMIANNHRLEIGGDSMIGTAISNSEARIALDVGTEARFFRNPYLPETRSEMALPLISRGQVLGALSIQSTIDSAFSQEDITSLQTLADQLANAIENARLFEQTEIRAEELAILNEMARSFTQTLDIEQLINIAYQFAGRLMDAHNFYLALYDGENQTIDYKLYIEEEQKLSAPDPVLLGEGLTDWIIKNKLPVLMPNNTEQHIRALGLEFLGKVPQSWLGVPMLLENKVLGVLAVQSYDEPNTYSSHQLDLLSAVANQAAIAIDNAMRFQQTQARARFEQLLREITTRVHSSTNAESIMRTAVREVSTALGKQAFIELNPSLEDETNGAGQPGSPPPLPTPEEKSQKGER